MLIANGIFSKVPIKDEYSSAVGSMFGATSRHVSSEAPINEWVKETTKVRSP